MAVVLNQVPEHIGGDVVLAPTRYDDVCLDFGRLYERIMHRFDSRQIAGDGTFIGAVPLPDVPIDSPDQADIRFSIDKYFDVDHGYQLGYGQNQDSFQDDDRLRFDRSRFFRPRLHTEIIDRRLYVPA